MTDYSHLLIAALDSSHDGPGFHSGVASLDDYLHKQASQDVKRRISRVLVATTAANPDIVYRLLHTLDSFDRTRPAT